MQPTSAPGREDTASGSRRKWGEGQRGESMVAASHHHGRPSRRGEWL